MARDQRVTRSSSKYFKQSNNDNDSVTNGVEAKSSQSSPKRKAESTDTKRSKRMKRNSRAKKAESGSVSKKKNKQIDEWSEMSTNDDSGNDHDWDEEIEAKNSKKKKPTNRKKKADKSVDQVVTRKKNVKSNGHVEPPKPPATSTNDTDSDDDDWEEVEDAEVVDLDDYKPDIPDNIQITIDSVRKPKKTSKEDWIENCIRQRINRALKEIQLNVHKVHLLFFIHRLQFLNSISNESTLKALIISTVNFQPKSKQSLKIVVQKLTAWFEEFFTCDYSKQASDVDVVSETIQCFRERTIHSPLVATVVLVSALRYFGYQTRLCYFLHPVPLKPFDLLTKRSPKSSDSSSNSSKTEEPKSKTKESKANPKVEKESNFYWIEVFDEKRWISVDVDLFDDTRGIVSNFKIDITYIIAIDNDGFISEVTPRYASEWVTHAMKKRRIEDEWWEETLELVGRKGYSKYDDADRKEFDEILAKVELPTRMTDYKNHPLFVLNRDLLKFQAIYPPDAPALGFFKDEPVYSRECVHTLKSRETWLREARTVKPNETAYKVTTSRFKIDRNAKIAGQKEMLDLFGKWQTKPYEPPIAENGIVPRNAYGNVELFQPSMIPKGTVHLQLPGLARVAAKLNIDCVPAVVGFDNNKHGRGAHPVMDGFIVCSEHEAILVDAWNEQQEIIKKREEKKRLDRIYGNWKRLIKGLIIRQNLKIKYG